jgi:hypothetical protein
MTAMTDSAAIFVYILECSDRTLYCGWTNNLQKRLEEHSAGKAGAKYTRGRRPVGSSTGSPARRIDAPEKGEGDKWLSRAGSCSS